MVCSQLILIYDQVCEFVCECVHLFKITFQPEMIHFDKSSESPKKCFFFLQISLHESVCTFKSVFQRAPYYLHSTYYHADGKVKPARKSHNFIKINVKNFWLQLCLVTYWPSN